MSDVEFTAGFGRAAPASRSGTEAGARRRPALDWRRLQLATTLIAADLATVWVAIAGLVILLRLAGRPSPDADAATLWMPAALMVSLHGLLGLYRADRSSAVELFRLRCLAALVFAFPVVAAAFRDLGPLSLCSSWAALVGLTLVVGLSLNEIARLVLTKCGIWQTRVVLIGDPLLTRELSSQLDATPALGMTAVARLQADDPRLDTPGAPVGETADVAVILSCGDGAADARIAATLSQASVIVARDAGDLPTAGLRARLVGGLIGIEVRRSLGHHARIKRLFDLAIGSLLFVCALPVIVVFAGAVWGFDRRFPFYAQPRIGFRGQVFRVWKIRSMFVDAEARLALHLEQCAQARAEWERGFKLADDPRILPWIGALLRRSSLDEIPQLWNVLRGDMSLVGPRPFPAYHLAVFDESFRSLRVSVMPGLTGYWQITSRSDGDLATQCRADTFYLRNRSLWFDLYILFQTIPAVLAGKGAR